MPAPDRKRLLFISNGYGEDSIAAELIRNLPKSIPVQAWPMIGEGRAYDGVCPIVGPRAAMPSEGWRNVKGSLLRDIRGGALKVVGPALRFLRASSVRDEEVVVVGDLTGVAACYFAGHRRIIWLDVYRTGYGKPYSPIERWLIKATCSKVFTRSRQIAEELVRAGIDATYHGNIMLDTITYGEFDVARRRSHAHAVTLLPGSRQFTRESFDLQVAALRLLPVTEMPDLFLAVASSIEPAVLAEGTGLRYDGGTFSDSHLIIFAARGATGNLIEASEIVLSQAGTATVQAIGLGKPAITFRQPRDRESRFEDEQRMFGDGRIVTEPTAEAVAEALLSQLRDPAEMKRRGEAGRERVGRPGALKAIVRTLSL